MFTFLSIICLHVEPNNIPVYQRREAITDIQSLFMEGFLKTHELLLSIKCLQGNL